MEEHRQLRGNSRYRVARNHVSSDQPTPEANSSPNKKKSKKNKKKAGRMRVYPEGLLVIRLPKWLDKIVVFCKKHRLFTRIVASIIVLALLLGIFYQAFESQFKKLQYQLSPKAEALLMDQVTNFGDKLVFDSKDQAYYYNRDYKATQEGVGGEVYGPKFSAKFSEDPNKGLEITDPGYGVSFTLVPQFRLGTPEKDGDRLIYPLRGKKAAKVITLRAVGYKEDIILEQSYGDSIDFAYELKLPDSLRAQIEKDGSLAIYGTDNTALLGNVATGSENDAKLLDQARKNSPKTKLIFKMPAPFIRETGNDYPVKTVSFSLEGNILTMRAEKLAGLKYPLSVDPTVYIETARKLMRGNNETNVDFDVANELFQKSQTTGARIDSWSSTTNLTSAVYGQGTAVAGGFIYSAGGVGSSTTTTTVYNSAGTTTYNVPSGVTSLTVKTWGAGGGGGGGTNGSGSGGNGGGGGYAKAVITVTPLESLNVDVGTGGAKASANGRGGNGGGYSAVRRGGTFLVEAGGGGGGGGRRGNTGGTTGNGGAGGGSTGVAATAGSTGGPGQGGTTSAGGTGGTAGAGGAAGVTGAANAGGNASSTAACATAATGTGGAGGTGAGGSGGTFTTSCAAGGGGGGGRYGGGGGGSTSTNNRTGGGGGGGSSLVSGTSTVETQGSGTTPGNSGDSDRAGLGDGGTGATTAAGASDGDGGIVVISYTTPGSVSAAVYWAEFDPNTNAIGSPNPGTGACSGWCTNSAYNLPTALTGLSLVSYNGFLYAIGGSNSGGTPQTTVYIAKLGANGEPQLWHPTGGTAVYWYTDTALSNARSQFAAVAYNNRMYILGGLTTSTTVLSSNTVQYANINPNGTLTTWTSTGMSALSGTGGGNRYGLTAHAYNDTIYVIGGNATFSGTPVTNVDYVKIKSDGTMNSWVATEALETAGRLTIGGSFSTVYGGYIYANGGCLTVNSSGYCTSIASDVQLTSINADGSLAGWNTILGLTNDRFAHTTIAWQGGLYRLGGCRAQDSGTGICTDTALDVDYGVINPDGEASTVATSVTSGTSPCTGTAPYNCSLPSSSVGNMLNSVAVINGYLYIMGGCTNNACTTRSSGITYQAVGSDGSLQKPASCAGTYSGAYCVSSTSLPSARGAAATTIFNSRLYLVGGFPTITDISHVTVNYDGSLGTWVNTDTTTAGATDVSYAFAYARANPASAGSVPGNLYIIGGCSGTISGIGCSGYSEGVYKCNLDTAGTPSACTTTGQLQIGTVTGGSGTGLGAFAGAVYANYIYLMGGLAPGITDLTTVRYARFDDNNNIVTVGSGWVEGTNEMNTGRRRGSGFGYNGYLYVLGGYDGADAIADIEFAKINVSDGSWEAFDTSSVTIQKRWALAVGVSNSYAYVVGGCTAGAAPSSCSARTDTVQTFQVYNNNSGTPISYSASGNQFTTDRMGAGTAIHNGYMYVAGGCISTTTDCDSVTDNVQFASIDAYGTLGTWANTTDSTLPQVRGHGKLLVAANTLYWVGGQNSAGTAQTDVYFGVPSTSDGNVSAWTLASNVLPAARTQFGAASWNNRLYITGGLNGSGTAQNTVYISPSLSGGDIGSAWSSSTTFDVARSGHVTVAYANNLYVFGGYDGTNYLSDSQFTQINVDGTVDAWTFTTSLPTRLRGGDGFAANGYMYVVGGRSTNTNCSSKTLVAPVSANTTIASGNNPTGVGEWFETNVKYQGPRYGSSVSYANGKYYVSGGVCSGFPTISDAVTQEFSTAATSHNVTMPSTVNSGDLLLTLFTNDGNATVTTPSGWTAITNGTQTRGANVRGSIYAKVADGTEDSTSVNFVTSATEEGASQVYRVKSGEWSGSIAGVEAANGGDPGATTTTPNPPSLNPGAWGTENTLWISYAAGSSYTATTTYPTNYNGGKHNLSNTGTGGASASSGWYESAAASEDPGSFTMSTNSDGVAFTIAIRPAGYALTGSNKIVQTAVYSQPQEAIYSRMIDTDTDVFPTGWLLNGLDNSIGARWQGKYRSMHDVSDGAGQQNPNEDCGTAATMPLMTTWGSETDQGDITLGDVMSYTAKNSGGSNINCARYFYFYISIDASQTFGYPEDVDRGPTIADLSLFFTADPSKRLRHGKSFTGGEQQPLDTPCRQSVDAQCPLP